MKRLLSTIAFLALALRAGEIGPFTLNTSAPTDPDVTLVVASVRTVLKTNTLAQVSSGPVAVSFGCTVLHAPGTVCDYYSSAPKTEVTTVTRERIAEIEGKQFVLSVEEISRTTRAFTETVTTSTNRIYLP